MSKEEFDQVWGYIKDHLYTFGFYPADAETNDGKVYTIEEYMPHVPEEWKVDV